MLKGLGPAAKFHLKQIVDSINGAIVGVIKYIDLDFSASNITKILTRNHNDLQNFQGGASNDYQHLTTAQLNLQAFLTHVTFGAGAPNNANGSNGDYYLRSDGGALTHLYFKSGGTWSGIV